MDFRSILQSMNTISEAEGRVHKGTYGTSYGKEDVRDQYGHRVGKVDKGAEAAKDAPKKGRGRPKKDGGEGAKFDSSALSAAFGGKKPSGKVGTVSAKHSLKEYIEAQEQMKRFETVMEGMFGGDVDHGKVAGNLAKLARVIKSVQTPEQFRVAQKYAQRMSGAIQQHQHAGMGFGSGLRANLGVSRDIQSDLKRKAAELGIEYNALEEEELTIKPLPGASQIVDPSGETIGTADAQTANVLKQAAAKGTLNLDGQKMAEGKKAKPDFLDVDKDKNEKESFKKAVKDKEAKKVDEAAKPDFKDVDKDGNEKESWKKAEKDKKDKKDKVDESISFNEMSQETQNDAQEMLAELQADIDEFINTGHCSDKLEAFLKVHGHSKKKIADEATMVPTSTFTKPGSPMAQPRGAAPVSPAVPATGGAAPMGGGSFLKNLTMPTKTFESNDMKDMQVESWTKQLNGLLTEGITVSSSQGQQGAPDSVSVTANDADAQQLLAVLRQAGLGVFGGGEQPHSNYGAPMPAHGEEPEGHGTEPEASPEVADVDDDIMSLIKKMTGIEQGGEPQQGGEQPGTLEPAQGGEEHGEDYKDEEGSEEESGEGEEEVTDEGNDGNLANNYPPYDEVTRGDVVAGAKGEDQEGGHAEEHEEDTCESCGHSPCDCSHDDEEKVEEGYANEPDEEMAKLKALLSMGNDMHRMKGSQAVGNPVRVAESNMINDWKKLSGIK